LLYSIIGTAEVRKAADLERGHGAMRETLQAVKAFSPKIASVEKSLALVPVTV
jgi:hypothetical protein